MIWELSYRSDPLARPIADRHYNRQNIGADGFVPPGRCVVLKTPTALWVTSWPLAQYVKHAWAGAWVNSCFRRESGPLASDMIREAVAATRSVWPEVPELGMVTFINRDKVKRKAGFRVCGETKGGLLALQLLPADMPEPEQAIGMQQDMFA